MKFIKREVKNAANEISWEIVLEGWEEFQIVGSLNWMIAKQLETALNGGLRYAEWRDRAKHLRDLPLRKTGERPH